MKAQEYPRCFHCLILMVYFLFSAAADGVKIPSEPLTSAVAQRPTDGNQDSVVNTSLLPELADIEGKLSLSSILI